MPLLREMRRLPADQTAHAPEAAAPPQEVDGGRGISGIVEERHGPVPGRAPLFGREIALRTVEQELPEQGMILVDRLLPRVDFGEEVVPVQVRQDPGRLRMARQRLGRPRRHPRQERGPDQERPDVCIEVPEQVAAEIFHDLLGRYSPDVLRFDPVPLRPFQQENDAGHPSIGLAVEVPDRFQGGIFPLDPRDLRGLPGGQPEFLPSDGRDPAAVHFTDEIGGRLAAAREDRPEALREVVDPFADRHFDGRARDRVLPRVEHQDRRETSRSKISPKYRRANGLMSERSEGVGLGSGFRFLGWTACVASPR